MSADISRCNVRAPAATPETAARRQLNKAMTLLVLVGLLAYANSFGNPFHMDDALVTCKANTEGLVTFVTEVPGRAFAAATFHFNYCIHGSGYFGYHLVNAAIHFLAGLVLFGIVRRILLLPRWQGRFIHSATWLAFGSAMIFLIHPAQTQAVTYIVQRMESLMGLFYLLAVYCVLRGSQSTQPGETAQRLPAPLQLSYLVYKPYLARAWFWYLGAWLCCACGAACKEVMITILPVLFGFDFVFLGQARIERQHGTAPGWRPWSLKRDVLSVLWDVLRRRWVLYFGIAAICAAMSWRHVFREKITDTSAGFGIESLPLQSYWMAEAWVLLYYIRFCFIPYPQYLWYRGVDNHGPVWTTPVDFAEFLPAGVILGALALLVLVLMLRRNWLGFLGWWFFGVLSITCVTPMIDYIFEHRLYLSIAAFSTFVVVGSYLGLRRFCTDRLSLALTMQLTLAMATALIILTILRNEQYRDDFIWTNLNALARNPCEHLYEMLYVFIWRQE